MQIVRHTQFTPLALHFAALYVDGERVTGVVTIFDTRRGYVERLPVDEHGYFVDAPPDTLRGRVSYTWEWPAGDHGRR